MRLVINYSEVINLAHNNSNIPQNHVAIVRALRYRRRLAGLKGDDPDGVIAGVLKQKNQLLKK